MQDGEQLNSDSRVEIERRVLAPGETSDLIDRIHALFAQIGGGTPPASGGQPTLRGLVVALYATEMRVGVGSVGAGPPQPVQPAVRAGAPVRASTLSSPSSMVSGSAAPQPSEYMSLQDFLTRYGLTYSVYRVMRRDGTGPKEHRLTRKTIRFKRSEVLEWERQRFTNQPQPQPT